MRGAIQKGFISVTCFVSLMTLISECMAAKETPVPTLSGSDRYWQHGAAELQKRLDSVQNNRNAKNVILFIADGMGISTITAARIFDGQSKKQSGEENYLSFERFPNVALVKTYNSDSQVPDSAGTASALNTGVKTRRSTINIWADQPPTACYGPDKRFPQSIAEIAETRGLSTGIVSTTRITHATPAAVYGHSPSRNWESDAGLPDEAKTAGCKDLAQQMLEFDKGDGLDVMLGGGRRAFLQSYNGGTRNDGRNLVQEWQQRYADAQYVSNARQFRALDIANTRRLLGLFSDSHMAYEHDRDDSGEPSLTEMTARAIDILARNNKGYFLMVESGRVDHAHHATNAYRALTDAQEFSRAIQAALDKVNLKETLILVTADHSHLFTIAGYPGRGNPILGLVHQRDLKTGKPALKPLTLDDGKPYTTLGYYIGENVRTDKHKALTDEQVTDPDYIQQAAIRNKNGGFHSGEDVAIFAAGPKSHLVSGVIEQNTVFHIITHALGWRFESIGNNQ